MPVLLNPLKSRTIHDKNDNMYDLFRILATIQVAVGHINTHVPGLQLPDGAVALLSGFPGVPIFFAMAGYFACQSLEKKPPMAFLKTKFFRLYPWLIIIQLCSLLLIGISTPNFSWNMTPADLLKWVVLCYTPPIMSGFGGGVINGALWTIPVEVMFYCLMAVVYPRIKWTKKKLWAAFAVSLATAIGIHVMTLLNVPYVGMLRITPIPYLYIFVLGGLMYWYKDAVRTKIRPKRKLAVVCIIAVLILYLAVCWIVPVDKIVSFGRYGVLRGLLIPGMVLILGQMAKIRCKHDYTYLVYLLHMPVICCIKQFCLSLPFTSILASYALIIGGLFAASFALVHLEIGVKNTLSTLRKNKR